MIRYFIPTVGIKKKVLEFDELQVKQLCKSLSIFKIFCLNRLKRNKLLYFQLVIQTKMLVVLLNEEKIRFFFLN